MAMLYLTKILTRAYREDEGDPVPTTPVAINPAAIRCFNARRDNMPGTRLTFTDGGGFAVVESYDDIVRYVTTGEVPVARAPISAVEPTGLAN